MKLMYINLLFGCPTYVYPLSIQQCPDNSRIVHDTKYMVNLRTKNLRIKMLVLTFRTTLPAVPRNIHL